MPYIKHEDRLSVGVPTNKRNPGLLNFLVTTVVDRYIADNGISYESINAAIGVLECAKLELYRRIAVPYEDKKIKENGDVYTLPVE